MVVLKKIKASTLMETLVATVLIVIVFMIASMVLNSMVSGNMGQHTELAEERLHALEYQYKNQGIRLPYYEDYESWEISITQQQIGNSMLVLLEAENPMTKKTVVNYITHEE